MNIQKSMWSMIACIGSYAISSAVFADTTPIDKMVTEILVDNGNIYVERRVGLKRVELERKGPYGLNDRILEPYGLYAKYLEIKDQGVSLDGLRVSMAEYLGDHIRFLKRSVSIGDDSDSGTFFMIGDVGPMFEIGSRINFVQSGNERQPQVDFHLMTAREKLAVLTSEDRKEQIKAQLLSIKSPLLHRVDTWKSKNKEEYIAFQFNRPDTIGTLFALLDQELLGSENHIVRVNEINDVLKDIRFIQEKSLEYYVYLKVDEIAHSNKWLQDIVVFTTKAASRQKAPPVLTPPVKK